MQYKSPIKLLLPFLEEHEKFENINFDVIKKRILAEFELTGKTTIKTRAGELSKNEVIVLFDGDLTRNFKHHLTITKIPGLLNFLETNKTKEKLVFTNIRYKDEEFVRFLSPYLAHSLGKYFASFISNTKRYLWYPVPYDFPILEEHVHLLIEPVASAFEKINKRIEQIQEMFSNTKSIPDASVYYNNNIIRVVNLLSPKYFALHIEMYLQTGFNFIQTYLENRKENYFYEEVARIIFYQLKKSKASKDFKAIIILFNDYLKDPEPKNADNNEIDATTYGTILMFAVMFIIFLILFNSHSSESSNQRRKTKQEIIRERELQKRIKTFLESKEKGKDSSIINGRDTILYTD